MKLSEIMLALESGKTIYETYPHEVKRYIKMLEVEGSKFFCKWYDRSEKQIDSCFAVDANKEYQILEESNEPKGKN